MNKNILLLLLISITAQAQHHATQSRSRKNEIPGNLTSHVADGFKKKYTNICQNDRLGDVEKRKEQILCLQGLLELLDQSREEVEYKKFSAKLSSKLRKHYESEIVLTQHNKALSHQEQLQIVRELLSNIHYTYSAFSPQQPLISTRIQQVDQQLLERNIVTIEVYEGKTALEKAIAIEELLGKLAEYIPPSHDDAALMQKRLEKAVQVRQALQQQEKIKNLQQTAKSLLEKEEKPFNELYRTYVTLCKEYRPGTTEYDKWQSCAHQALIEYAAIQDAELSKNLHLRSTDSIASLEKLLQLKQLLLQHNTLEGMSTQNLKIELQDLQNLLKRTQIRHSREQLGIEIGTLKADVTINELDRAFQLKILYSLLAGTYNAESAEHKSYAKKSENAHDNAEIIFTTQNLKDASIEALFNALYSILITS